MAYFARCVYYAGTDCESFVQGFYSIIELAHRKGGEVVKQILYKYLTSPEKSAFLMADIRQGENARNLIFSAPAERWQKTTRWLYPAVRAHNGYFVDGKWHEFGSWAKVGTPAPWRKRRRKKPLEVGNPSHIILVKETAIGLLKEKKCDLWAREVCLEEYSEESDSNYIPFHNLPEYDALEMEVEAINNEIESLHAEIRCMKDELRFRYARAKGVRYWKRSADGFVVNPGG